MGWGHAGCSPASSSLQAEGLLAHGSLWIRSPWEKGKEHQKTSRKTSFISILFLQFRHSTLFLFFIYFLIYKTFTYRLRSWMPSLSAGWIVFAKLYTVENKPLYQKHCYELLHEWGCCSSRLPGRLLLFPSCIPGYQTFPSDAWCLTRWGYIQ